ncbi:MAG: FAS1-like dehydratase domain-containing protein [Solirubrobacterales bacterium]
MSEPGLKSREPPVGKTWPAQTYEVGLEKIREYARAVGEDAAHFRESAAARDIGFEDIPAPPVFAAVFCAPAVATVIFDPAVGLFDPAAGISSYRFVHKRQEFWWRRPVIAGDVLTTTASLSAAETLEDGRVGRAFESVTVDINGEEVVRARYEGVVPPARSSRPRRHRSPLPTEPSDPFSRLTITPDRYAPVRYAGASGDFTPFHLDRALAQSMGLDGPILHGLYSFAQLARAHTRPFGGDPRVLKQLSGSFKRPAYPEREMDVSVYVRLRNKREMETRAEIVQQADLVIGKARGLIADPVAGRDIA